MNKIFYKKNGQITPFMLAIMVILIMAVMVTINIGKVSLTKTHSANAADAGALAGASAMANVFNMIADANEQMIQIYDVFLPTVEGWFIAATYYLVIARAKAGLAMTLACPAPCTAKEMAEEAVDNLGGWRTGFIGIINTITTEVTATYLAQWNFYNAMRDNVLDGHNSAVRLAFQLAFSNSGISQKLIPGFAPSDPAQLKGNANNYQSGFSNFMDGIWVSGNPVTSRLPYPWIDGQNRTHQVDVNVSLEPPEKYEVRLTILPYWTEMLTLRGMVAFAFVAKTFLNQAAASLAQACRYKKCCSKKHPGCCAAWAAACSAAVSKITAANAQMFAIVFLSVTAKTGILPGGTKWIDSASWADILVRVEEVGSSREEPHNGRVRVETVQAHQGADLGVWQTQYPNITSFSVANFRYDRNDNPNQGRINPPESHHEASIVQTD